MADHSEAFDRMMENAGLSPRARSDFALMYADFLAGTGCLADWDSISPPFEGDVADLRKVRSDFGCEKASLDGLTWIILNGGLGTSMKMDRAKSLLPVSGGRSFLELIAAFADKLRRRTGAGLPLLFMNSAYTRVDTLTAIEGLGAACCGLPADFEQHLFPRVRFADSAPLGGGSESSSWAPPGHGDFYSAIHESGALDALLEKGFTRAFVSNADNLGASPDPAILAWMEAESVEFVLEVTPKTEADVKGGSLVRAGGVLSLLEIAQVPADRVCDFQDTVKFPAFNTNNLWLDLRAVKRVVEAGGPRMPLIVNRKKVDGVEAVQLERAIGAAISSFDRSFGLLVDRGRFAPVKTVDDLVVRRSDCFVEGETSPLEPSPKRPKELGPPKVSLDRSWYESVEDLDLRIPHPLSLVEAESLAVTGDVRFGRGVRVVGRADVTNLSGEPLFVPDGSTIGDAA